MFVSTCSLDADCGTCSRRMAAKPSQFLDCGTDAVLKDPSTPCTFCNQAECCRPFAGSPHAFEDTASFNSAMSLLNSNQSRAEEMYGPLAMWDISRVTSLYSTFQHATFQHSTFDVSKWDVSKVTTLSQSKFFLSCLRCCGADTTSWHWHRQRHLMASSKCLQAYRFNADLSKWDVSNVNNMHQSKFFLSCLRCCRIADTTSWHWHRQCHLMASCAAFSSAHQFNDLSKWDVQRQQYVLQ